VQTAHTFDKEIACQVTKIYWVILKHISRLIAERRYVKQQSKTVRYELR
jgi:hypothetical protein